MEVKDYATETEIAVVVKFDYQPEEKPVFYPNDLADPGCPAEVTINEVIADGVNIINDISDEELDRLNDVCWDYMQSE